MAQGQGSPELLPFRPNHATPVSSSELRDLFSWTDRLPGEEWEKSVSGQLTIHRFSEPSRTNPDRVMERGRCEATLSAPLETVFALVDDPKERAKWDEIAGATLKKYRSRSHDFVSFTFEGLMGLASQDFLFWDAQQSYDKHGVECDTWMHSQKPSLPKARWEKPFATFRCRARRPGAASCFGSQPPSPGKACPRMKAGVALRPGEILRACHIPAGCSKSVAFAMSMATWRAESSSRLGDSCFFK